jgi:catechol 2,3-dioxygenase-like lactoylglutathione lyase family enzyme
MSGLVPEFYCSDFLQSLKFYTEILGFKVRYARIEERFAYLERENAELMIEQTINPARTFITGELAHPYGRGMNLQITVSDVDSLYANVQSANCSIFLPLEDKWYRADNLELGNRQFVVSDPDGYLLRFAQQLGERSIA